MDAIQRREIFIHMRYANMTGEWTITIITSVISAIIGGVVTLFIERRKERREDKKENEKKKKKVFKKRPELKITEYKEYLSRPGHKLKKECDINVFMTKMEDVSVEGDCVTVHYNKDFFNEEEWCCVIYEFRNVGKTDIRCVSPICTYKKDTMLCDVKVNKLVLEHGSLSYSTMYDKKVRVDESFTMRICYHKPHVKADGTVNETFFGYCKEDGFKKKKNLGRIEQFDENNNSKWKIIEEEWLSLFNNKKVVDGKSAMASVDGDDEWLCEAYMKTDYSKLTETDFQQTLNNYLAYAL